MTSASRSRIAIIGAGEVASAFAFAVTQQGLARELAIVNRTVERAEGEAMDLNHAMALSTPMKIEAGGYELCADADVVVVTCGASQEPGESRLDLAKRNADIVRQAVRATLEHVSSPIFVIVTNPVDVMTSVAIDASGLNPRQVIGSGTVLDSARFRFALASQCDVDPRNMHCHVIGEHGDSEIALWSRVNISGVWLKDYCSLCSRECSSKTWEEIEENVRTAAYRIIERKGSTCYGIALALMRITGAILRDEKSVLTISALMQGQYGIEGVCLSLPRVLGRKGIEAVLPAPLNTKEEDQLHHSARVVAESLEKVRAGS